jgi:TolB protein
MSTKALATVAAATLVCGVAAFTAAASHATRAAFPGKNGRIVFNDEHGALDLVNPDGTGLVRLAGTNAADVSIGAAWSPNGTRIAYSKQGAGGDADIFTIAPDASGQREITFSRGSDIDPTWSGDGSRIAFETNRNGNSDIYSVAADGSDPRRLTDSPLNELDPSWSAATGRIAYTVEAADKSTRELWVMNGDGSGKTQLTSAPNYSSDPNWSPDGRWLVFESDRAEKGNFDVYRMRADGTGVVQLTSSPALDALPAFSPDGKKIVFVSDRAAKDSRKLFAMSSTGGTATRLIDLSGSTYQMVPDWQPVFRKDPCTIRGTINADHLIGTPGPDVICGLGGDDTIQGLGGDDRLLGGAGDDWLQARDGARDVVDGGPGRDAATVDKKLDTVSRVEELKRK